MYSITKEMLLDAVRHLPRTIYNLLLLEKNKRNESQASLIRDLVLSYPYYYLLYSPYLVLL